MIEKMTRYSFILLSGEEKAFLEQLQEVGVVDITRSHKPVDESSMGMLTAVERYKLLSDRLTALTASLTPSGTCSITDPVELASRIESLLEEIQQNRQAQAAAGKELEAVESWGSFDPASIARLEEAGVPLHFHISSQKEFREEWAQQAALQVIHEDKNKVWYVVAGEDPLPDSIPAPKRAVSEVLAEMGGLVQQEKSLLEEAATLSTALPLLQDESRAELTRLDRYLAHAAAVPAAENTLLTLEGYAPTADDDTVTAALDGMDVFYWKEAAEAEQNPPIRLRNNRFVRMFEVLTDMYGRPAYNGFDPTPFISIFFMLFFALCMGDAGYGLVLIVVGLLLKKVPSFKDLAPLVVTLGGATVVVGFFLHTFFSIDIATWSIFAPVKKLFLPDEIGGYAGGMVLSVIIGIVHLCLAMVVKAIESVKTKGWSASWGTLGWTLLIVGGVLTGSMALIGVLSAPLTKIIVITLGVVSALGIFVFNDPVRNKFANMGIGLWDTYNTATGLLGDVLSYLRLYALGLAGSMLGMAFNDMGKMVLGDGSSPVGWTGFVLLVVLGHTLNIAMCALGAFVHPLRLNFLEFFKNSGYSAEGRNYQPLQKQ